MVGAWGFGVVGLRASGSGLRVQEALWSFLAGDADGLLVTARTG